MEEEKIKYYENNYNQFIEEFKKLPLKEKQKIIIDVLKDMIALITKLCLDSNIKRELLLNKEMSDLTKDNYTEDDFAEAVYCYLNSYNNQLSGFLKKYIDDNYE